MQRPLAALLVLAALPALADRPLVSETADVIGPEACQVEAALAHASSSGLPGARLGDVFFSCGLPAQSQAGLGYSHLGVGGERFESLRLAGKTTLVVPEDGRTGWGLAYGLIVDKTPDRSWRSEGLALMAVATREVASGLLAHANLGWTYSRGDRQSTTCWSLGMETTADFTVAADLFGDDRGKPGLSAGFGYTLGKGLSVNLSHAVLLDTPRVRQWTLGAKFAF